MILLNNLETVTLMETETTVVDKVLEMVMVTPKLLFLILQMKIK